MKKVLIYGDSNTWGDNFITGVRISDDRQWPNILGRRLKGYHILQEGLPGRIAGNYEIQKPYKNGQDSFISVFRTNAPVDIVIIALGTNDLQLKYQKTSQEIIDSLIWYKKIIEKQYEDSEDRKKYFVDSKLPQIIFIMPIEFDYLEGAKGIFDLSCHKKRLEIIQYFSRNYHDNILICPHLDLFDDGIHLNYVGHEKLAKLVEEKIKNE